MVPDEQNPVIPNSGKSGSHGAVVADSSIAVHFDEILKYQIDIVQKLRPFFVAGNLDRLPIVEVAVDAPL